MPSPTQTDLKEQSISDVTKVAVEQFVRICVVGYFLLLVPVWVFCNLLLGMGWFWSLFVVPSATGLILALVFPLLQGWCCRRWATKALASVRNSEDVVEFLKTAPSRFRPPAGDAHAMVCDCLFAVTTAFVTYGGYCRWGGYRMGTDNELAGSDALMAFLIVLPAVSLTVGVLLAVPFDYGLRHLFGFIPNEWVDRLALVQASPREVCRQALVIHEERQRREQARQVEEERQRIAKEFARAAEAEWQCPYCGAKIGQAHTCDKW